MRTFFSWGLIWDLCTRSVTNTRAQGQHKSGTKLSREPLFCCLLVYISRFLDQKSDSELSLPTCTEGKNTSEFWSRHLFDKIQMLCCIFPPCFHLSSSHIHTTWSCLKRFPPTTELLYYSHHCTSLLEKVYIRPLLHHLTYLFLLAIMS